jgi:hypothetical protein
MSSCPFATKTLLGGSQVANACHGQPTGHSYPYPCSQVRVQVGLGMGTGTLLPLGEFAYNNHIHSSMQHSPFFVDSSRHPRMGTFLSLYSALGLNPLAQMRNSEWSSHEFFQIYLLLSFLLHRLYHVALLSPLTTFVMLSPFAQLDLLLT